MFFCSSNCSPHNSWAAGVFRQSCCGSLDVYHCPQWFAHVLFCNPQYRPKAFKKPLERHRHSTTVIYRYFITIIISFQQKTALKQSRCLTAAQTAAKRTSRADLPSARQPKKKSSAGPGWGMGISLPSVVSAYRMFRGNCQDTGLLSGYDISKTVSAFWRVKAVFDGIFRFFGFNPLVQLSVTFRAARKAERFQYHFEWHAGFEPALIVAVSAGWMHTVGLKSDGTVVATGDNGAGQCDVSGWTDIGGSLTLQ